MEPGSVSAAAVLTGGTQNLLVRFEFAGRALVVRLPPATKRDNSDETMRREARVLAALADSGVPHPRFVAAEPTDEPLGAAFVIMEMVDGARATGELGGRYAVDPAWRGAIGVSMARAIAGLGQLDPQAIGLDDLGRPGSFTARQAGRWLNQLQSYAGTAGYEPLDPAVAREIGVWLESNLPPDQPPGLLHGDFHTGNVLLSTAAPEVGAVVDWELATVGDPLLDLGQLLVTWPDRTGRSTLGDFASMTPADGLANEADLVAAYRDQSRRDLSGLAWYKVLAAFRLAAIIEGTWARGCAGLADPATGRQLHTAALALLQRAKQELAGA